jgi:hypothetical protein
VSNKQHPMQVGVPSHRLEGGRWPRGASQRPIARSGVE